MKKTLLLAVLLMVALVAVPAHASVQNVKISGSVESEFVHRQTYDFGYNGGALAADDEKQSVFRSKVMLQVDADLSDNVSATVQLMNERIWDAIVDTNGAATDESSIDLNLAFVTLREMLYSPMTVTVGRQKIAFGNKLILDGGSSGNATSGLNQFTDDEDIDAFDAIRFTFDYNPLTLDVFYVVIDEGSSSKDLNDSSASDESRLYGIHGAYELGDEMGSLIEGYLMEQKQNNDLSKADVIKVIGIKASTSPLEGLNIQAEFAHQGGTKVITEGTASADVRNRDAYAVQLMSSYALPVLTDYAPVVSYSYTKLSGEKYQGSGVDTNHDYAGWDPMYEGQTPGKIANRLFTYTDLIIHSISISGNPMEDVTSKISFVKLLKDKKFESGETFSLLSPGGTAVGLTSGSGADASGSSELGYEIDIEAEYAYTEDVTFGVDLDYFFPGDLFEGKTTAKQVLANVKVNF